MLFCSIIIQLLAGVQIYSNLPSTSNYYLYTEIRDILFGSFLPAKLDSEAGLGPNRFILICRRKSKIHKRFWSARCIKIFLSFWFTWTNNFLFWFILICDSIWFYSLWFGLILILHESRFTRESWFTYESKIKSNQKSKVGESWFTHFRMIGWFDFQKRIKANRESSWSEPWLIEDLSYFFF